MRCCADDAFHLEDAVLGVDDLHVDEHVHRDRGVVLGDAGLGLHVQEDLSQVDHYDLVNDGPEGEDKAGPFLSHDSAEAEVDFAACADLARAHANVFFDCCFIITGTDKPPAISDTDAVAAFRNVGCDRIMFGSDFPWYDPGLDSARIQRFPLTNAEKRAVLHENAIRVLGL